MRMKLEPKEIEKRFKARKLELLSKYNKVRDLVKVKCFCGNIFETKLFYIFMKDSYSCGCIRSGKFCKKWKGFGEISGSYFKQIKYNSKDSAKRKKLKFNITIEYIWNLFLLQNRKCAISGEDLKFSEYYNRDKNLQTASLDRINSSMGYVIGNVQWVHKRVNQMKLDNSKEDFLKWIEKIYNYNKRL